MVGQQLRAAGWWRRWPGAIAEWVFVPERPGTYELHCAIAGHAEAGMVGTIAIVAPTGL